MQIRNKAKNWLVEFLHPTGIHPWRWRGITIWIIAFCVVVALAIRQNREYIHKIGNSKASIFALQQTDCGLKKFLLTARKARLLSARDEHGYLRRTDLRAAHSYVELLKPFSSKAVDGCHIPRNLEIKRK